MFTTKQTTLMTQTSKTAKTKVASSNAFLFGAAQNAAVTVSGNGAKKFSTTGNSWVDQFGKLGTFKAPRSYEDIARDCSILYAQDKETFVKFTIYLRMISRKTDIIGYKTTKEWSEYIGIPIPTMFKRLQDLQRLGKIKTKTYRVKASVTIRKIQHYRIDPEWLKLHGL
jgi:hypothetical protein